MSLDIAFSEDIERVLTALDESNAMTLDLATAFGANKRDIALVRFVYQSALEHVATAFGLPKPDFFVTIVRKEKQSESKVANRTIGLR